MMIIVQFLFWCVSVVCGADPDWVLNHPSFDHTISLRQGIDNKLHFIDVIEREFAEVSGATDGEKIDLVEKFFWGMEDGVIIELGAVSGGNDTASQSLIFEDFGWRRILLEGNPTHREGLKSHSKAFSANVAMCNNGTVHYSSTPANPLTSGIIEFMSPSFMKQYHKQVFNLAHERGSFDVSSIDWSKLTNLDIISVPCVGMGTVLDTVGVAHVNAFLLDVEGAEPQVLQSIDFGRFKFDVIVIERNQPHDVMAFMKTLPDYKFVVERGRNFWFQHRNFQPSVRPGLREQCYRGCTRAGIHGCPKHCKRTGLELEQ